MIPAAPKHSLATVEDLLAIPDEERFHEVIGGQLVQKAIPSPRHGSAQRKLSALVDPYQRRPRGPGEPGGWLFVTEVEVYFETHEIYRPDVTGWRRERLPDLPAKSPITVRPDWVCEILSPSNHRLDRVDKLDTFERCGVPHYWIIDPVRETLRVHRWSPNGYVPVLTASRGDVVHAEPFEVITLRIGALFGEEEDG